MPINESDWIWQNGKLVPWSDAQVHVLTHGLHYGSTVFEGIRVYATPLGSKAFRLQAHTQRMFDSAKIYRIDIPYTMDQVNAACREVVIRNQLTNGAYIRPIAYRGYGEIGLAPSADNPIEIAIAAWEWGAYLGAEALEKGVDVCVSSWQRAAPNTIPALAKAGGNDRLSISAGIRRSPRARKSCCSLATPSPSTSICGNWFRWEKWRWVQLSADVKASLTG